MESYDMMIASERRNEIRLDGKQVEGIKVSLVDPLQKEGWDQHERWESQVHNLSAGGIEVRLPKGFPKPVDQQIMVMLEFPKSSEELHIPSIIRHIHFVGQDCLVGLQFLWQDHSLRELDLEYRFCNQLMWCERQES